METVKTSEYSICTNTIIHITIPSVNKTSKSASPGLIIWSSTTQKFKSSITMASAIQTVYSCHYVVSSTTCKHGEVKTILEDTPVAMIEINVCHCFTKEGPYTVLISI